jgi:2-dehydropantoate 2-reductase
MAFGKPECRLERQACTYIDDMKEQDMRILVVGAGAIGGYFGGRLLDAGRDVTFLVREKRAQRLKENGLNIRSPNGDLSIANPPVVLATGIREPFDLVLLSCKAYDLDNAIESIAAAVGPNTAILPMLNGMRHLDALEARFGADRVLGGQCVIATTLDAQGTVVQLNPMQSMTFGERAGGLSPRIEAIAAQLQGAGFEATASPAIIQSMWEKWVFLATLAAGTCMMRAPVGDIIAAPGGQDLLLHLFDELSAIAAVHHHPPGAALVGRAHGILTAAGSPMTASMLRDIENGAAIEADHVVGDLLARGTDGGVHAPILATAYTHLKAYEARRERSAVKSS